jgi:hypothetical protein
MGARMTRTDRVGAAVALVVFAAVRSWLAIGRPVSWSDTKSYDVQASKSLLSARFWAGRKPPGFPLLLKLVGSHETVIVVQVALSIVAWALLAWVVASLARAGWPRLVSLVAVLVFAMTTPIAIWDRVMLSESIALSCFALLVTSLIWFGSRPGWIRLGAVVLSAGAWISTRDTNIYVVLGIGVVLGAAAVLAFVRRSSIGPKLAIAALLLVLVGGGALAVSISTVRGWDPLRHVLADRIIPYPDRLNWWVDHGLPQGAALRVLARHPSHTDTGALTAGPSARDRHFARYSNWVKNKGARTYVMWLASHPKYAFFEPFETPERVHLRRAVTDYSPHANEVPLISTVFFWPWPAAVGAFVLLFAAGLWRRRARDVTWLVGLGLVVLAVPHLLLAWHGDSASPIRHALLGNVQAILGILLLGLALLPRVPRAGDLPVELEDPGRVLV